MSPNPLIIDESLYEYLKKYASCLVPKRRNVVLVFDLIGTSKVCPTMKPLGTDQKPPPFCMIICIRSIVDVHYQPIGTILSYETTNPQKIAKCIRAFISDLKSCDLTVVATLSSANRLLTNVVMHLVEDVSTQWSRKLLKFSVGDVVDIVHLYDPSGLLVQMRETFFSSVIDYTYKGVHFVVNYRDVLNGPKNAASQVLNDILSMELKKQEELAIALKLFSEAMYLELKVKGNPESQNCADFLLLIDQIFDSMNATEEESPKYRQEVRKDSKHFALWAAAVEAFDSMTISKNFDSRPKKTACRSKKNRKDKKKENITPPNTNTENMSNKELLQKLMGNLLQLSQDKEKFTDVDLNKFVPPFFDHWLTNLKGFEFICRKLAGKYRNVQTTHFSVHCINDTVKHLKMYKNFPNYGFQPSKLKLINIGYFVSAFTPSSTLTIY